MKGKQPADGRLAKVKPGSSKAKLKKQAQLKLSHFATCTLELWLIFFSLLLAANLTDRNKADFLVARQQQKCLIEFRKSFSKSRLNDILQVALPHSEAQAVSQNAPDQNIC